MSANRSVVWIRRGDRRTVDHAGLLAALRAKAAAVVAVADGDDIGALSNAFEKRGTSLKILSSNDEARAVADFARQFDATTVHVRLDETEESRAVVHSLTQQLNGDAAVEAWRDEYHDWNGVDLTSIPYEYPTYKRWRNIVGVGEPGIPERSMARLTGSTNVSSLTVSTSNDTAVSEPYYEEFMARYTADSKQSRTLIVPRGDMDADEYGTAIVSAYLEAADAYNAPDLARTLSPVFREGLLSGRRICELVKLHERLNGRIWRPVYREGAKRVLDYLEAREFAQLLARRDLQSGATVDGTHTARFWRWQGYLIRYVDEGKGPAVLLVHGFGASSQHFAGAVSGLVSRGYRAIALDVLGYGRSEKPPTAYTQDLWQCVLYDFVRQVVGAPVYMAGNSIGGYFAASFAADAPSTLCSGLVLLNSAGKLEEAGKVVERPRSNNPLSVLGAFGKYVMQEWGAARMFAANLLLQNLRGSIGKTLKLVYPTHPERADEALAKEIYRNSLDFGANDVLASGLVLPPPRSLTELLGKFNGRLLVYQGSLDPLNSAGDRADKILATYPTATVAKRDLGYVLL